MQVAARRGRPPLGHPVSRPRLGRMQECWQFKERRGWSKVSWERAAEIAREGAGGMAGSGWNGGEQRTLGLWSAIHRAVSMVGCECTATVSNLGKTHFCTLAIRTSIRPSVRPASPLSVPPSTQRPHVPPVPGNHPGDERPLLPPQRLESGLDPGCVRKCSEVAATVAGVAIRPPEARAPAPHLSATPSDLLTSRLPAQRWHLGGQERGCWCGPSFFPLPGPPVSSEQA